VESGDFYPEGKKSLAHCFLFSKAEQRHLKWTSQLPGFHFVSKEGLDEVPTHKWMRNDNSFLLSTDAVQLTEEMNTSTKAAQDYLKQVMETTGKPESRGMFFNEEVHYNVIKQLREIPENCLPLFQRVMNCAERNVSRPKKIARVPVHCKPMEYTDETL